MKMFSYFANLFDILWADKIQIYNYYFFIKYIYLL